MTRWPRYLSPGWLAAYATGATAWLVIVEVSPLPVLVAVCAVGALALVAIANLLSHGSPMPERRE